MSEGIRKSVSDILAELLIILFFTFFYVFLVFQSDIKELQAQFRRMGTAIIGMGRDLSPHYRCNLQ